MKKAGVKKPVLRAARRRSDTTIELAARAKRVERMLDRMLTAEPAYPDRYSRVRV